MQILRFLLWLLVSVALQVLLFNHLSLYGGIVMIYVVALLKLPVEVNRVFQIIIGFLVGFLIDIFSNTPGMHALAATTVMFFREPILHLFNNDPEFKNGTICFTRVGISTFIRYAINVIALHAILLYLIESFSLFNLGVLLTKILVSLFLTFVVSISFEFATMKK